MKHLTVIFLFAIICHTTSAANYIVEAKFKIAALSQSANDYFQIGFSAATNGQYDAAITNYTQAIQIDPNRIYFYYHRGLAYRAMGKKSESISDFKQCVAMKPIAEAYYQLGVFKYEELDLSGAKAYFEKARELKDDIEKLDYYLGVINYRFNNFDSAEAQLSHYTHLVKTNADAFLYLAMTKVKQHKFNEVPAMLKLATLYNDNDWKLHLKMYDIYKEMDDKDNMLYHISMVIEMGQTKPEYYNIRAKLYLDRGEDMLAQYDLLAAKGGSK